MTAAQPLCTGHLDVRCCHLSTGHLWHVHRTFLACAPDTLDVLITRNKEQVRTATPIVSSTSPTSAQRLDALRHDYRSPSAGEWISRPPGGTVVSVPAGLANVEGPMCLPMWQQIGAFPTRWPRWQRDSRKRYGSSPGGPHSGLFGPRCSPSASIFRTRFPGGHRAKETS
jgi:hypothetical protein